MTAEQGTLLKLEPFISAEAPKTYYIYQPGIHIQCDLLQSDSHSVYNNKSNSVVLIAIVTPRQRQAYLESSVYIWSALQQVFRQQFLRSLL